MILLLNYLPTIIFLIGIYFVYKTAFNKSKVSPENKISRIIIIVVTVIILILGLQAATPHYMPKHQITRSEIPYSEPVVGEIKNIQPQPVSGEERDAKRKQDYSEKIPFVEQNQK